MPETSATIQELVRAQSPLQGQGYPPAVRARVVRYVRRRRAAGLTWTALALEVGLSTTTLSNWSRDSLSDPEPSESAFLPVRITPTPPATPPAPASATLSLTSPTGWRIDGLDLPSLTQLLPALS